MSPGRDGLDPDEVGGVCITGDPSVLLATPPPDGGQLHGSTEQLRSPCGRTDSETMLIEGDQWRDHWSLDTI